MKRYILYSAAVLLLGFTTSCERDCDVTTEKPGVGRMEVNVTLDGVQPAVTKAQTTDIDLDARGFTIAGYYTKASAPVGDYTAPGDFSTQIATAVPNIFNLEENPGGGFYPSIRDLKKDAEGKYHVLLSKWVLSDDSYLSYIAWSANTDVAVGAAGNPITAATGTASVGQPFLDITADGKTDIVAAISIDNQNNVVRGACDLNFKHIFSKLNFQVVSKEGEITLKSAKLKATAAVCHKGRYNFNLFNGDYAGNWAPTASTAAASFDLELGGDKVIAPGTSVYVDSRLMIPQKTGAGDLSLELTYTLQNPGGVSTYTRSVALPAAEFIQNSSYIYELHIREQSIEVGDSRIAAWNTKQLLLPQVVGPRGDVILLLDGSEPPYTAPDGTQYVLDHSGYNNHCRISGSVGYDHDLKCYVFTNGTDTKKGLIMVPALGDYTGGAMTVEVVAQTWSITYNELFSFYRSGLRQLFSHYIADYGATFWDAGCAANSEGTTLGARISFPNIASHLNKISLMSYTYDASGASKYQHVMRNMQKMVMNSDFTSIHNSFNLNEGGTIGHTFEGSLHQFKIIKKAKRAVDPAELKALAKKFNFPYDSYVQDGLLIDLEGETAPSIHAKQSVWVDNSPNGNHAYYNSDAAVSGITYDAANKCYKFTGKGFMQFIKTIGNNTNNITLEVVVKSQNSSGGLAGGCVVQFNTKLDVPVGITAYQDEGGIYWPYNNVIVLFEAAQTNNIGTGTSERRFNIAVQDLKNLYGIDVAAKASISFVRDGNTLSFRYNNKDSGVGTRTNTEALPQWTVGRVGGQTYSGGGYTGAIYAIRLYNRVLTDEERKANYELDKKLYNL